MLGQEKWSQYVALLLSSREALRYLLKLPMLLGTMHTLLLVCFALCCVAMLCLLFFPLLTAASRIVTQTIPAGSTQEKQDCLCLEHNLPLPPSGQDYVTAGDIHFGSAGQQSESIVLHSLPSNLASPIRDCWHYENSGVGLRGLLAGKVYIELHSQSSDADPTLPAHGIIRTQLSCLGYELDFHDGLYTTIGNQILFFSLSKNH